MYIMLTRNTVSCSIVGGSLRVLRVYLSRVKALAPWSAHKAFDGMSERNIRCQNSITPHLLHLIRCSLVESEFMTIAAMHCLALKFGSLNDAYVSTSLLTGYARAGDLNSSWGMFFEVHDKDVVSWNAMMSANIYTGRFKAAMSLFGEMMSNGNEFDSMTLLVVLSAVSKIHSFDHGRVIHGISLKLHVGLNSFWGNALLDMYAKCGDFRSAESLFVRMDVRDATSWNSMMSGYLYNGYPEKSVSYFKKMWSSGVRPDSFTLSSVISACSCLGDLECGECIHGSAMKLGYDVPLHVSFANALVSFYLACDYVAAAEVVFDDLIDKDLISWNAMISGLVKKGRVSEALAILRRMKLDRVVQPDSVTVVAILSLCTELSLLRDGKLLHAYALRTQFKLNLSLTNTLLDMYMKCDGLIHAENLFKLMPCTDLVSWNTMISGYSLNGYVTRAQLLFQELLRSGLSCSPSTILAILPSCICNDMLQFGKAIHCWMLKSGFSELFVVNALLLMYMNCGDILASFQLFTSISKIADVDSWNSLIVGCVKNSYQLVSLEAFKTMRGLSHVNPDSITLVSSLSACGSLGFALFGGCIHGFIIKVAVESDLQVKNALLTMYFRFGDTQSAELIFHSDLQRNLCSWNCMISGFTQNKDARKALELFPHMEFEPNEITIVSILNACAQLGALQLGRETNARVFRFGFDQNAYILAALVDMYSKCGRLERAIGVFQSSVEKSIASWNSMILAYGFHGYGRKAIELFSEMCQSDTRPTNSTFISLLSACSHSGLVDEGIRHYLQMSEEFGVSPTIQHHVCVVDMLGRAGRLAEAYEFVKQIPSKPAPGVWGALLGACKDQNNVEMGKTVAEHLFLLEPENVSYYVSLSNLYAAAGLWGDMVEVRRMLQERGLRKSPGCSVVDVGVG